MLERIIWLARAELGKFANIELGDDAHIDAPELDHLAFEFCVICIFERMWS